ncbi:MAG: metal-dependent hydrolase [Lachnospiraceae bacterium]|nr:metal-dependent hydrolase [Lachnospiraceae bacterium]
MSTHAAVGACVGLALTMNQPAEYALVGGTLAMIGGIISDIDVGETGKKTTPIIIGGLSLGLLAILYIIGGGVFPGIIELWKATSGLLRTMVGSTLFFVTCLWGMRRPHRSFLHSLLGMAILGGAVYLALPVAAGYFLAGMVAHVVLDVLNYRPVQLFYPLEKGVSLRLCYSKSQVSNAILVASIVGIAALLLAR